MSSHVCDDNDAPHLDDGRVPRSVRLLGAAVAFGALSQHLLFGRAAGLNVPVAIAVFLAFAYVLRAPDRTIRVEDGWLPAAALTFACLCAIRTDKALVFFDATAALALSMASVVAISGTPVTRQSAGALLQEALTATFSVTGRAPAIASAAASEIQKTIGPRARRTPRYVAGVAVALPFAFAFSALFASADAVYARTVTSMIDPSRWPPYVREALPRAALRLGVAWLAAGAFARLQAPARRRDLDGAARHVLSAETATAMLATLDLLFCGFVILQVNYLFGGQDTMNAAGIPYSAYARRGFFELIAVGTLVGAMLFGLGLRTEARSRANVMLSVALMALTGVVLVSAWYRLDLYQRAYGWTELRFYAIAVIVALARGLAILAASTIADRMRFAVQPMIVATLAVALALNALSPSAFVARADLERQIDPSGLPLDAQRQLDAGYVVSLGDGAIPVIVALLPALPGEDRERLSRHLRALAYTRTNGPTPWESFDVDREAARQALLGFGSTR